MMTRETAWQIWHLTTGLVLGVCLAITISKEGFGSLVSLLWGYALASVVLSLAYGLWVATDRKPESWENKARRVALENDFEAPAYGR